MSPPNCHEIVSPSAKLESDRIEPKGVAAGKGDRERGSWSYYGGRSGQAVKPERTAGQAAEAPLRAGRNGLVRHGNRGQSKPWRVAERNRAKVLRLAESKYAGFNDWHFTEKLQEVAGMELSRETVRRILRGAGRPSPPKRRAPRYRSRRERRPRKGMMVLTDGSRELWLEGVARR